MDLDSAWRWIVMMFWTIVISVIGAGMGIGYWLAAIRNR